MVMMIMMEMLGVFSAERCGEKVKVDGKLIFNIPWCLSGNLRCLWYKLDDVRLVKEDSSNKSI